MGRFSYRGGVLHVEDVPLARIAAAVGTPAYVYSSAALVDHYREFAEAFADLPATVCYALKANDNLAVVATFAALGAGADVVSEGELRRALRAGVPPRRIVFAGIGKTEAEMAAALDAGILQFNVESLPELAALDAVSRQRGRRAPVAIRVNPDVDARTHAKITTGRAENKFGVDIDRARAAYAQAAQMPGIEVVGVAVHIGSQLTELAPYRATFTRIAALAGELRAQGHAIRRLDLGGGLGIDYGLKPVPSVADYAATIREAVGGLGCDIVIEPGRRLVGDAGVLLTRVLFVKEGASRTFVVVDAGMNDLIRPALYDAYHAIVPVREPEAGTASLPVDVVGPICESADIFAEQRPLPPVRAGDLLVVASAGAYGAVMASGYNGRLPAPEVMVRGADFEIVRPRPDHEAMMARDRLPAWLAPDAEAGSGAEPGRRPAQPAGAAQEAAARGAA
ncbi:MAG: diaminopimelate decarboxylase [Rhodospirillaceae bacterium]|nr:diaminopimelate decarboxylase [Rhodospirillaceae bacterium]